MGTRAARARPVTYVLTYLRLQLSDEEVAAIDALGQRTADDPAQGRLCWRTDPLRMLEFQ